MSAHEFTAEMHHSNSFASIPHLQEWVEQYGTKYKWTIENFSMCPLPIGEHLKSNTFYVDCFDVSQYQLVLLPRGRVADNNETPICLLECLKESYYPINVTMRIAFGEKEMEMKVENIRMSTGHTVQFPIETQNRNPEEPLEPNRNPEKPLEPKRNALLPEEITIICTIILVYDPEMNLVDYDSLFNDLKCLYESQEFADFGLTSLEGDVFPVHKVILIARCPELANEVDRDYSKESAMDQPANTEILKAFVHFVYTGDLLYLSTPTSRNDCRILAQINQMDDLLRELNKLEICESGRTIIAVNHCEYTWNISDFRKKLVENSLRLTTSIDFEFGSFIALFGVFDHDTKKASTGVFLKCQSLKMGPILTVKCVVRVLMPDESNWVLCEGGFRFDYASQNDFFRLKGDLFSFYPTIQHFPDSLKLLFDFNVSHQGMGTDQCTGKIVSVADPHLYLWCRSGYRLSTDLDNVFRNTWEGMHTHSDLRVRVDQETFIHVHKCILSARSTKLRNLISKAVRVDNVCEISLTDYGIKNFYHVLRCVYSNKVYEGTDMTDLLVIYDLGILTARCMKLMRSKVNLDNLKLVLQHPESRHNDAIFNVAVSFISKNKDTIKKTSQWAEIMQQVPIVAGRAFRHATGSNYAPF